MSGRAEDASRRTLKRLADGHVPPLGSDGDETLVVAWQELEAYEVEKVSADRTLERLHRRIETHERNGLTSPPLRFAAAVMALVVGVASGLWIGGREEPSALELEWSLQPSLAEAFVLPPSGDELADEELGW